MPWFLFDLGICRDWQWNSNNRNQLQVNAAAARSTPFQAPARFERLVRSKTPGLVHLSKGSEARKE